MILSLKKTNCFSPYYFSKSGKIARHSKIDILTSNFSKKWDTGFMPCKKILLIQIRRRREGRKERSEANCFLILRLKIK